MTDLPLHTLASLVRVVVALAVSVLIAVPSGLWAGRRPRADRWVSPVAYLLYPVPKIALLPALIVVLGLGEPSKIALLVTVLVFPLYLAARDGVRAIDHDLWTAARTLDLGPRAQLVHVVLPGVLPRLFSVLRLAVGMALSVLFFAESYATDFGLGAFIMNQWSMMRYAEMTGGIVAISLLGWALFVAVDQAERLWCPWTLDPTAKKGPRP